jgi:hypothetical protein
MKLTLTPLPGVVVVEPQAFGDARGWFMESWNEARFNAALAEAGLASPVRFVQDNHSRKASWCAWSRAGPGTWRWTSAAAVPPSASGSAWS